MLKLVVAGACGAALTGGIAFATIPSSGGVIDACYNPLKNNQLRVIDTESGQHCKSSEVALSWNQSGPPAPPSSGAGEVDYIEKASDVTVTNTSRNNAKTIIVGHPTTYNGSRVFISFMSPSVYSTIGNHVYFVVYRDTTLVGEVAYYLSPTYADTSRMFEVADAPPAGTHTYTVKAWVGSGDAIVRGAPGAVDGNAFVPMHLRVSLG
jgi:hypothetical protein